MSIAKFAGLDIHPLGMPLRQLSASAPTSLSDLSMSAANNAVVYIGRVFWTDGGTHTVDTSGSSAIGLRTSTATLTSASTTVKAGMAAVDTSNGPAGRPVNSAGVITPDVAAVILGNSGLISANTWNELVPTTGSKTIAHGDLVSVFVQMTLHGASDTLSIRSAGTVASPALPNVAIYNGSFAAQSLLPNCVIRASDGTRGCIFGGCIASALGGLQTFSTGTTIKECGNVIVPPYPAKAVGFVFNPNAGGSCDFDVILYEDPFGTPVARASGSVDANTVSASGFAIYEDMFTTGYGYQLSTTSTYAIVGKPTTANSLNMFYRTFGNVAHQAFVPGGAGGYAVNRNTGAFSAQNSQLDRFDIGLLVEGGDTGASGGGLLVNPGMRGGML